MTKRELLHPGPFARLRSLATRIDPSLLGMTKRELLRRFAAGHQLLVGAGAVRGVGHYGFHLTQVIRDVLRAKSSLHESLQPEPILNQIMQACDLLGGRL